MRDDSAIYIVRPGYTLYWRDLPSGFGSDGGSRIWARAGEFVDATHPVLRLIVRLQKYKVIRLRAGDRIPVGSVLHRHFGPLSVPPSVAKRIHRYDHYPRTKAAPKPVAPTATALVLRDGQAVSV